MSCRLGSYRCRPWSRTDLKISFGICHPRIFLKSFCKHRLILCIRFIKFCFSIVKFFRREFSRSIIKVLDILPSLFSGNQSLNALPVIYCGSCGTALYDSDLGIDSGFDLSCKIESNGTDLACRLTVDIDPFGNHFSISLVLIKMTVCRNFVIPYLGIADLSDDESRKL